MAADPRVDAVFDGWAGDDSPGCAVAVRHEGRIVHARVGGFEDGLPLLEQAVGLESSAEPQTTQTLAVTALAEANFLAGKLDKASMIATEVLLAAATNEERGVEAYASRVLGMARSASDEPTLDEYAFNTAVAIAAELGQQPLLAHDYLGLATLDRRTDRSAEAKDYWRWGEARVENLDMRPWIPLRYFSQARPFGAAFSRWPGASRW